MRDQCVCRIHVLSGAFSEELAKGSDLWKQAESTYVTNLRIAADECAKVDCNLYMLPPLCITGSGVPLPPPSSLTYTHAHTHVHTHTHTHFSGRYYGLD